jgi:hypothetical protein
MARYDGDPAAWTRYDTRNGLTSYAKGLVYGEVTGMAVASDASVFAGGFGTLAVTDQDLIRLAPYLPVPVNRWRAGDTWEAWVFDSLGSVSAMAFDRVGRLWVTVTRGGAARDGLDPDLWKEDALMPGALLFQDEVWHILTTREGLPGADLSTVAVAPDGSVWVGTEGAGLGMYVNDLPPTPSPTPSPTASQVAPTQTFTSTPVDGTTTQTPATHTATPTSTIDGSPTEATEPPPPSDTPTPSATAASATPSSDPLDRIYLPFSYSP